MSVAYGNNAAVRSTPALEAKTMELPGYSIEIAHEETKTYYASIFQDEPCSCGDCIWFRKERDAGHIDHLESFLSLFCIDYRREIESPHVYDDEKTRNYNPWYHFYGKILEAPYVKKDRAGIVHLSYQTYPGTSIQYLFKERVDLPRKYLNEIGFIQLELVVSIDKERF